MGDGGCVDGGFGSEAVFVRVRVMEVVETWRRGDGRLVCLGVVKRKGGRQCRGDGGNGEGKFESSGDKFSSFLKTPL